jgi:hypothetical protein
VLAITSVPNRPTVSAVPIAVLVTESTAASARSPIVDSDPAG